MNITRKFLALAAIPALAIALPASAQSGYGGDQRSDRANDRRDMNQRDMNMSARVDQLQTRLQSGIQSGAITRREAIPLRQQLRQLSQLERRYSAGGINNQERSDLQRRMQDIRAGIRRADGNDQARWDRFDREDGYDRDGRWSDASDSRYAVEQPRTGLAGFIDSMMGNNGPSVGQSAPSDLYALPDSHRQQYRDGNGAYYRTDGRQIYQIDTRSRMVTRVHPMNR